MTLIDGASFAEFVGTVGITHLVWIPDSTLGRWEEALRSQPTLTILRPAREGEAIAIAAGLWLGGARPLVAMQCTGFFEAGDALRNVVYDLGVPVFLIVGCRSFFARTQGSTDTAAVFAEPILKAWGIGYTLIDRSESADRLRQLYTDAQARRASHVLLLAE